MIQRAGVAHWPHAPYKLSNMTLIHTIPFAQLLSEIRNCTMVCKCLNFIMIFNSINNP